MSEKEYIECPHCGYENYVKDDGAGIVCVSCDRWFQPEQQPTRED
jgi:transcription elongation factor Elf1